MQKGEYKFPKKLMISIQGLHFLNCCLQFNTEQRLNWSQLVNHEYIRTLPAQESQEAEQDELIYLTYCKTNDTYVKDDIYQQNKTARKEGATNLLDSTVLMMNNPHNYLNQNNAILLNVNDNSTIQKLYEDTLKNHLKKRTQEILNQKPVLKLAVKKSNRDKLTES